MKMPDDKNTNQFFLEDGMLKLPVGDDIISPDRQVPHARQFCLCHEKDKVELDDLLQKAFKRTVLIWMIDRSWSKDGDMNVAVFYSDIKEKEKKEEKKIVIKDKNIQEKEDNMFKEFIKSMEVLKEEDLQTDLIIEDDS